jgi:hypothetical protein
MEWTGVSSDFNHYEWFNRFAPKCKLRIPDTVLFEANTPTAWLFNPRHGPRRGEVLKKKMEKTKLETFVKEFCLRKISNRLLKERRTLPGDWHETIRNESLILLNTKLPEVLEEPMSSLKLVIVKGNSKGLKRTFTIKDFLHFIKDGTCSFGDCIVQEYLERTSTTEDIYVTVYQNDLNNEPPSYKFMVHSKRLKGVVRSCDRFLNQDLRRMTDNMIAFYEAVNPRHQVKHIELRFMPGLDAEPDKAAALSRSIYFIGANSLEVFVKLPPPQAKVVLEAFKAVPDMRRARLPRRNGRSELLCAGDYCSTCID